MSRAVPNLERSLEEKHMQNVSVLKIDSLEAVNFRIFYGCPQENPVISSGEKMREGAGISFCVPLTRYILRPLTILPHGEFARRLFRTNLR